MPEHAPIMPTASRPNSCPAWLTVAFSLLGCPQLLTDDFDARGVSAGGAAGLTPDQNAGGHDTAGTAVANAGSGGRAGDTSREAELQAALVHRYRFDGVGARALDSVGSAHGNLIGASLLGTGQLELPGGLAQHYVDLPNGIISSFTDATFETWLVWKGGPTWQRIFDFGTSYEGENQTGAGESYIFLTPMANVDGSADYLRASYSLDGYTMAVDLDASAALPRNVLVHVAVVIDTKTDLMSLYLDGRLANSAPLINRLSAIADVNNWIGRSQFQDAWLAADILEFRIYRAALSATDLAYTHTAGPDPRFLEF